MCLCFIIILLGITKQIAVYIDLAQLAILKLIN